MRFGRLYRCSLKAAHLLLWRRLQQYGYILIALMIALVVIGIRQLGGFQWLELKNYDSRVRYCATDAGLPEVVVVGITEADIRRYNQWPLSDNTVAQLLEQLQTYEPAAIGLDIYRDIDHPPGRDRLVQQLAQDNVYGVYDVGLDQERNSPAPKAMDPDRTGFADLLVDADGVIRRNFMYASVAPDDFYSLSLQLSLHVLENRYGTDIFNANLDELTIVNTRFPRLSSDQGGYQDEDMTGYQVMLQYQSNNRAIQQVSLTDVLDGNVEPEWFRDRVVLVGTVARSVKDTFFTPLNNTQTQDTATTPGVLIHAHAVSQILSVAEGDYPLIWGWSQWQEILWIGLWCFIGGLLAWHIQRFVLLSMGIAIALLLLFGTGWILFLHEGWIPIFPPALGFAVAISSTAAYQVFYRTFYDPLTSLPNRLSSLRRLQHYLSQRHTAAPLIALLLIDIDLFKSINESLGVKTADRLLQIVAERIVWQMPQSAVARVGGGQFAVILPSLTHSQEAITLTERLRQNLMSDSIKINRQAVSTTLSIGIAHHKKGQPYSAHELLQDAHRALDKAKTLGRDRYEVFNEDMRARSVSQFQLEMELRHADHDRQFQLYYQPIIELNSGIIAGFEALIRWQHPQRGIVPPNDFIGIAEDSGMILQMGDWILDQACCQIRQWQQQFPLRPPLFVGVNLSSRQFAEQDLAATIAAIVQRHQINPCGLKLELTESVAMDDVESAIQQLLRLKEEGLHISLDDFGTGYSSLSYLHRLPIDSLKIDKSFVQYMETIRENEDIVGTIITLGHRLKLDIIAEGVETLAQAHFLKQLACQYAQGYFFAKPLPEEQATQLLVQNKQWPL